LFSIFAADIFPIFAIAAAGHLLARFVGANVKTVSHVCSISPAVPVLRC
jgi:hypothetical protein